MQNHMKTKEEIRHYLDTQFSPSEDDMVSIVRNDFDRILNSAASCAPVSYTHLDVYKRQPVCVSQAMIPNRSLIRMPFRT